MLRETHFHAMNTRVAIWLWSASSHAADLLGHAARRFAEVEAELSRFRPDSGLSRLNATAGQGAQPVSPLLWTVLSHALQAARTSHGLFDPTVLRPLRAAGYNCSYELLVDGNGTGDTAGRPAWGWRLIGLSAPERFVELPTGIGIDLGGIAKGWTVDRVADELAQHGPVLVDAGGDIRAIGAPDREGWPIALQDPFDETRDRAVIGLRDGAVATSSIGRRRWQRDGQLRHHIIDPRTGQSSDSDLHTVTVVANTAEEADVAAKVALLLGARHGVDYLVQRRLAGLLIDRHGQEHRAGPLPTYHFTESS